MTTMLYGTTDYDDPAHNEPPLPIPRDLQYQYFLDTNGHVANGEYEIANGLWNQWVREGRRKRFAHDFQNQGIIAHPVNLPPQLQQIKAVCSRCKETRAVWRGMNISELNREGYCIPSEHYVITDDSCVVPRNPVVRVIDHCALTIISILPQKKH